MLHEQITKGLSVHGWPSGHALDSEETIQFTELEGVKCLIETFPLEKANEAFGKSLSQIMPRCWPSADQCAEAMDKGSVRFRAVITMD
jgi:D-arabinose 1-dehydrogenase-like Zn-dependent alcohol dehydrogenase